jgi:hypothetical protein
MYIHFKQKIKVMTTPTIHGYFVATNTASYGIHLSDDGTQAKLIMND